jgi:hypothetical protein
LAIDWNLAIERNREALKRILAALVAMAGLADVGPGFSSRVRGGGTLPRYLHTAVLRLLRPAESAVRRLVIVAARGVVVAPPRSPSRSRNAKSAPTILRNGVGTGILMPPAPGTAYFFPRKVAAGSGPDSSGKKVNCLLRSTARPLTLPLFDRLPRWETRPRRPVSNSVPRISVPGITTRFPIVPRRLPAPGDAVDATRLGLRFAALASALDDLPRQAKRFARWRARRDAVRAQERNRDVAAQSGESRLPYRPHRNWPLRPGRPPGWRRKPGHELHEILKDLHGLAFDVLESRDTS